LQGVSLRVARGEVVAVLGRNGVGKTTLIRSIVGFTPPRRGRIVLKGEEITRLPAHEIARRGVGLVPQGRRIFPSLAVGEHLQIGERTGNGSGWSVARVLDLFPRLRERLTNRGNKLSGGEQQMLACGRALVGNPDILLMDEPSEGLAPQLVAEVMATIRRLKEQGLSIVLVEQNPKLVFQVADDVVILNGGRVVAEGLAADFQHRDVDLRQHLGIF
jgi:branched-chain amino acid transport system ATP-binding protein